MTDSNLDRLQNDVSTIRQAMGVEPSSLRSDAVVALMIAATGLLAFMLWEFTSLDRRTAFWLALAPTVVALVRSGFRSRRERATYPFRWRETKRVLWLLGGAFPFIIGWIWWNSAEGRHGLVVATSIFVISLGIIGFGLQHRARLSVVPGGIVMLVYAAMIPQMSWDRVQLAGALALIPAGIGAAIVIVLQLRAEPSLAHDPESR